jgi:hypothetical protein
MATQPKDKASATSALLALATMLLVIILFLLLRELQTEESAILA